jgi:hypothetical protein
MSTYEQLKAVQQLLNGLVLEDDDALRARLRDGEPPTALKSSDIPVEVLSASTLDLIEYYARTLCERIHGRMGVPRGQPVVQNNAIDSIHQQA